MQSYQSWTSLSAGYNNVDWLQNRSNVVVNSGDN